MSHQTENLTFDEEVDVVVVGTGAAGLTAALAAGANGAKVALIEKQPTVGGTSAVSGGLAWIPAHKLVPGADYSKEDARKYMQAQSVGSIAPEFIDVYVETGSKVLKFIESQSSLRFEAAVGFPDYRPELPGGKPEGGRSIGPLAYEATPIGEWGKHITEFPLDFSNVGFDSETKARLGKSAASSTGEVFVAGKALIAGLLEGLLKLGIEPRTETKALELIEADGHILGLRISHDGKESTIGTKRGVILANGGFEWDPELVTAFLRGPMRAPVSPPHGTGDALRMQMGVGAALGNMGEAWWVPSMQIPGDTIDGKQRSRSVRLERTRPGSIIVNRFGKRFMNEAGNYSSMGGPFHYLDPEKDYANDPAYMVFDKRHLDKYGSLGINPGDPVPEWFNESSSLAELAEKIGVDAEGLESTVKAWNKNVADLVDPDFHRGASAYDGYWGDQSAETTAGKTLGPVDQGPFYAVEMILGCLGTKGGGKTDTDARVFHIKGGHIDGLYAVGNAMASSMGKTYPGAGATLGPCLVWGFRAGYHAATGKSFS